jgi:hypothetical protein
MADVYAVFGTLLALGIAFPGMLTGVWLLFPGSVERARWRLERTPYRTLFLGLGGTVVTVALVAMLSAVPLGLVKFVGALLGFGALAVATVGAAGTASAMGTRLRSMTSGLGEAGAFLRGAIALELAAAFPIVGWFVVLPVTLMASYGAGIFSLLRWLPRSSRVGAVEPALGRA